MKGGDSYKKASLFHHVHRIHPDHDPGPVFHSGDCRDGPIDYVYQCQLDDSALLQDGDGTIYRVSLELSSTAGAYRPMVWKDEYILL